jgi:flagellar biosynthesis/type III secretory pathway protein FliH
VAQQKAKQFPSQQRDEKESSKKKQRDLELSSTSSNNLTDPRSYYEGYDEGYSKGREGEMAERAKHFEVTREEADELYQVLAPQFVNHRFELVHALIIRLRHFVNED